MSSLKKVGVAAIVTLVIGLLALTIGYVDSNLIFIRWESIGKPLEPITKIIGTTLGTVTVETESGNLYTNDILSPDRSWVITTEIPKDQYSGYFRCYKPKLSKGMIDVQASCFLDPGGEIDSFFALKNDGNIYVWHGRKTLGDTTWLALICIPVGAAIGFISYVVYLFISWLRKTP